MQTRTQFRQNHDSWGSPQARAKLGQNSDSTVLTKALNKLRKNHPNISPPQSQTQHKKIHTRNFGPDFFSGAFWIFSGRILHFFLGKVFFFSGGILLFFSRVHFFFSGCFQFFFLGQFENFSGKILKIFSGWFFFFLGEKKKTLLTITHCTFLLFPVQNTQSQFENRKYLP